MKYLIFIPVLFFAFSVTAQEHFKVPDLTLESKYENMVVQTNYSMLNTINYAKSFGQSADDAGIFMGNLYKTSWNREAGFEGFVNGVLYNLICSVPEGEVTIEEQTAGKLKIKATNVFPSLYNQGEILGVTYDEYCRYLGKMMGIIAQYMGVNMNLETEETNWIVTLEKTH